MKTWWYNEPMSFATPEQQNKVSRIQARRDARKEKLNTEKESAQKRYARRTASADTPISIGGGKFGRSAMTKDVALDKLNSDYSRVFKKEDRLSRRYERKLSNV